MPFRGVLVNENDEDVRSTKEHVLVAKELPRIDIIDASIDGNRIE